MKPISNGYINDFLTKNEELEFLRKPIEDSVNLIVNMKKENKMLICGNGGSCADSEHIAGELLKSFMLKRELPEELREKLKKAYGAEGEFIASNLQCGVKAIPLTSFCAYNTAFLNDCSDKMLFAQLVNALGIEGDILFAISTSGNSANVLYAAKLAKVLGLKTIALTGSTGGKLKEIADVTINVPSNVVYRIQEYHLPIYHLICLCVEAELFNL